MCSFTKLYLKKKNDFFLKPKLPYESHLSRHTSKPKNKIVKIIETSPQSSKTAPKWIKFVKCMMLTNVHWCLVFNSFLMFYPLAKKT